MVILPDYLFNRDFQEISSGLEVPLSLSVLDDGDAFVFLERLREDGKAQKIVQGALKFLDKPVSYAVSDLPAGIEVYVIASKKEPQTKKSSADDFHLNAWIRRGSRIESCTVQIIKISNGIFSRIGGLYETDVLQAKKALIIGLGSGGSTIAVELAKAGVGHFVLVDDDRLAVENIARHMCGISDLGRFKTKAVRDLILDKNPSAHVETYEVRCDWDFLPTLRELNMGADIIFGCTDNRPSRAIINLASILEERVCIYGGTFSRAYGGHVLRVIPRQTMCYECFIETLPEKATDQEIANAEQAERRAYADSPVPVEPGLASDIAPIAIMCVKLGILELLRGSNTTLASLYEDLPHSLYQWLNRREAGTAYAKLGPLDSEDCSLRILAWYGINSVKNPGCPVCGDFIGIRAGELPTADEMDAFKSEAEEFSS